MDQNEVAQLNEQSALQQALADTDAEAQPQDDKLIDPKEVKDDLRRSILGKRSKYVERDDGRVVEVEVEDEDRQLCNEKGFSRIWSTIEGLLNTNVAGGYMSQTELNRTGYAASADLAIQLALNHKEFGIETEEDYHQTMSIVAGNLKANLSKSRGGRGLKHNEQTLSKRVIETISGSGGEEGSGFLGGLI